MTKKALITLVTVVFIFSLQLFPGELKGVKMDDTIKIDNEQLVLNGMALRKKFVFKVYVAGLYLPAKEQNGGKVLFRDTKRVIIMHFLRDVSAKKINGAWTEGLEDNTPNASAELKKQFDTLCNAMEDIKDEQQLKFIYIPGKGTQIVVNNKDKGTLKGKAFSDALLACLIGPKPGPGKGFKNGLLGKK